MFAWVARDMESASTPMLLEPVGELTPQLSLRLCDAARTAAAAGHPVVITLRSVARYSWAGLCRMADELAREDRFARRIAFRDVSPRVRSLLEVSGVGGLVAV